MAAACPKPRKCHSCGQEGHEQRDCPGKEGGRSYADAAAGREGAPRKGPQDLRPLEEVLQEVRAAREKAAGEAPAAVAEEGAAGAPAVVEVAAEDPAVEKAAAATPAVEEEAQAAEAEAAGMEVDEASRRRQRGSDGSAENSSDPDCWTASGGEEEEEEGDEEGGDPGGGAVAGGVALFWASTIRDGEADEQFRRPGGERGAARALGGSDGRGAARALGGSDGRGAGAARAAEGRCRGIWSGVSSQRGARFQPASVSERLPVPGPGLWGLCRGDSSVSAFSVFLCLFILDNF